MTFMEPDGVRSLRHRPDYEYVVCLRREKKIGLAE